MSLDQREQMQIAEIVSRVMDHKLDELRKEILEGFVAALDWHNDNFAKIMKQTNDRSIAEITKTQREVIEVRSRQYEERLAAERAHEQAEAEKSRRRGFTAKSAASAK